MRGDGSVVVSFRFYRSVRCLPWHSPVRYTNFGTAAMFFQTVAVEYNSFAVPAGADRTR